MIDDLKYFVRLAPARFAALCGTALLESVTEGLAVLMILPIMAVGAQDGSGLAASAEPILDAIAMFVGTDPSLSALLAICVGLAILRSLFMVVSGTMQVMISESVLYQTQLRLVALLQSMSYREFSSRSYGAYRQLVVGECGPMTMAVLNLARLLNAIVFAAIYIVLAATQNAEVLVILAASGAALAGPYLWLLRRSRVESLRGADARMAANSIVGQFLDGFKYLTATGLAGQVLRRADREFDRRRRAGIASGTLRAAIRAAPEAVGAMLLAFVLLLQIEYRGQEPAEVIVVALLCFRAFLRVQELPRHAQGYEQCAGSVLRVRAAIDDLAEFQEGTHPIDSGDRVDDAPLREGITVQEVTVRLGPTTVLDGLSLTVPAGAFVAIVGTSGAGKTTLANLLCGLLQPDKGQVLWDGLPVDSRNLAAVRRQCGYVTQETVLLNATVAENITLWDRPDATLLERALQTADAATFVAELPNGLDTLIGENGVVLSGGQRQRLTLAREFYRSPSLLVLDEATSALDSATEEQVQANLKSRSGDCTVVAIAHRISTVREADLIVTLDRGRIIEAGDFDSLIRRPGGVFRSLAVQQGVVGQSSNETGEFAS